MRYLSRSSLSTSAAVIMLGALASPSFAQTKTPVPLPPPAADTIWACYIPHSGAIYRIRVTNPAESCRTKEQLMFDWNVRGPQGPQGPQGSQGIQGPPGSAATLATPSGTPLLLITKVYRVGHSMIIGLNSTGTGSVLCHAGDVVVGGGTGVSNGVTSTKGPTLTVVESGPFTSGIIQVGQQPAQGWSVAIRATGEGASASAEVVAICLAIGQ